MERVIEGVNEEGVVERKRMELQCRVRGRRTPRAESTYFGSAITAQCECSDV